MVDDGDGIGPDWWKNYTVEKLLELLFAMELKQIDRNGWFTWTWIAGVICFGGTWWRSSADGAAGRAGDPYAFFWFAAGLLVFIVGVTLRVNGSFELNRLRRLQLIVKSGKQP